MLKLNKKFIIFGSIVVLLLIGILLFIFLGKDNKNSTSTQIDRTKLLSGYANDTEEAIKKSEFQLFENSGITFNVYGEVGYNDLAATIKEPIQMDSACSDEELENIKLGNTNNKIALDSEKIAIKNHCIIKLYRASDASYIISDDYAYILSAYIELPDGTLIALNSVDSPTFQVNIYDNETRIILEKGAAYFRILKQANNKIFTVQVGDRIFQTNESSELFVFSDLVASAKADYIQKQVAFVESIDDNNFNTYANSLGFTFNVASFQLVKGSGNVFTRGTNDKINISEKEYRFVYYPNYSSDGDKAGGYLTINGNDHRFNSFGVSVTEQDDLDSHKEFYQFLENQKSLNKLNYGFDNVTVKKADINEIMKNYLAYFTSLAKQKLDDYNANKPKNESACSYSWFLSMSENCGCEDGWYFISHVGCCPNGYTYSASENKCVRTMVVSSCPSGTYYVGNNKCCKNGTTLSSNGLSCVASSGTKSTPSYYPNSNSGATKTPSSKIKTNNSSTCKSSAQCEAKGNSACVAGMYEKDGKCCMDLVCIE
jgi:hypothetical protein